MNRWEVIAWDGFAKWYVICIRTRRFSRKFRCLLATRIKKKKNPYLNRYKSVKIYDRKLHKFVS